MMNSFIEIPEISLNIQLSTIIFFSYTKKSMDIFKPSEERKYFNSLDWDSRDL